jgi:hypothetical protein
MYGTHINQVISHTELPAFLVFFCSGSLFFGFQYVAELTRSGSVSCTVEELKLYTTVFQLVARQCILCDRRC